MTETVVLTESLVVGSKSRHASGWWAMLTLVATEAALFAYLFFSYFYIATHAVGPWPPPGPLKVGLSIPGTLVLIAGSVAMWWGERGIERGRIRQLNISLAISVALGIAFLALESIEWSRQPFMLSTSAYSSLYFVITGFHMLHVIVGVIMLAVLLMWSGMHYFDANRHAAVSIAVIYWHFVTFIWLAVFFTFYVMPHLG